MENNIDTSSPEYQAGLRAGRRSFRLSVLVAGPDYEGRIMDMEVPVCALLQSVGRGVVEAGPFRLLIIDEMPDFETYPDLAA